MELVGIKFGFHGDASTKEFYYLRACDGSDVFDGGAGLFNHFDGDPHDFVLSANLHRRHLTSEQKRELIAEVLKAKPEASNATVAKQTKTTDKTVAKVRRKLESTSEIPKLEKTVGKDGKARPKTKKTKKPAGAPKTKEPEPEHRVTASPEISIEQRRAENAQLDQPAETAVDEIYRRVGCVANTIRRQLEGLSYSDVERFFATLRDCVDELALR